MRIPILSSPKWTPRQKRPLFVGILSGCGTFTIGIFVYVAHLAYGSYLLDDNYDGYKLNREPYNYRYVSKEDEIIVHPAVIEYDLVGEYMVGLRMPTQKYRCRTTGGWFDLVNEKQYFILSTETGSVLEYSSIEAFEEELREIGIDDDVSLDYSMFYYMAITYPPRYNDYDYADCVPDDTRKQSGVGE